MKFLKAVMWVLIELTLYFFGLWAITGSVSADTFMQGFQNPEILQDALINSSISLSLLLVLSAILFSLLSVLWWHIYWLGVLILIGTSLCSIALALEYITFLDARLLEITAVILATLVVSLSMLSLIAALTSYQYKKRVHDDTLLHKLSVREPEALIFKATIRSNQVFLSPVILVSYLVFLYFQSRYSDEFEVSLQSVPTFTLVFVGSLLVLLLALVRNNRGILR